MDRGEFTDGNGSVTTLGTDSFGAVTTTTDALGRTTTIARDADSNPTQITQPNGAVTVITYDAKGNLLTTTDQSISATTTFTYEPIFNQVSSIQDPESHVTTIAYDTFGNPIEIIDAAGTITKMQYTDTNCPGQVTSITSAFGLPEVNTTSFQYDPATCNLTKTIDPLLKETTLTYDSKGNVQTSLDAEGKLTTSTYDSMNRLTQVRDHDNGLTTHTYDAEGNLISVADANNHSTAFTYDSLNRLKTTTDPLGKTETFSYDANGNLLSTTDRKTQTINFAYDVVNQLIQKTLPGVLVTSYTYDSTGNLLTVTDPDSSLTFTYDPVSRLTSSSTSGSPVQPNILISYTYDKNGNRKTLNDGSGITNYNYDNLNRLDDLTNPAGQLVDFQYDTLSRRKKLVYPNNTTVDYTYDIASQLTSLIHQLGVNPFSSLSYTYNNVGNRLTKTQNATTSTYAYDNIHRLASATNPTESYAYDLVGNRDPLTYQYNNANRLLNDGTFTYTYDDNGNLIQKVKISNGETTTYSYDAEDQLTQINLPGGSIVQYRYDGLGRRIEKDINGTKTRYIYDNEDILFEYDGLNTLQARYTHGLRIDEPLVMNRGGQSYFYHVDGLGSITDLTDATGAVAQSYVYDSFGNIVTQNGSLVNPYMYAGREFDAESGLYYYRRRYYDPTIGRFLQRDPIDFRDGLNVYAYVGNQPINYTDAYGFLNPNGACKFGICIYTKEDFEDGKKKLKEEMKKKYPWMNDNDLEKIADDIMKEMKPGEAQRLQDLQKNNKLGEAEELLKEICERTGANCDPKEPKEDEVCEQGKQ